MKTTTTPDDGLGSSHCTPIRELSCAETDHVSGGIVPLVAVAAVVVAAAAVESCSGNDESNEKSDD